MFWLMMFSACPARDEVSSVSTACFIAARTSGGRSVEVLTIKATTESKNCCIPHQHNLPRRGTKCDGGSVAPQALHRIDVRRPHRRDPGGQHAGHDDDRQAPQIRDRIEQSNELPDWREE